MKKNLLKKKGKKWLWIGLAVLGGLWVVGAMNGGT